MECLSPHLCSDLGIINQEDLDCAKINKRNFGPPTPNNISPINDSCGVKKVILLKRMFF